MEQTKLLQEIRKMRFEEAYDGWRNGNLTQEAAGRLLGMSERNFRCYIGRFHDEGEAGLMDKRLTQASSRCALVDEVMRLTDLYSSRYNGWNVKHFYGFYKREHDGKRRLCVTRLRFRFRFDNGNCSAINYSATLKVDELLQGDNNDKYQENYACMLFCSSRYVAFFSRKQCLCCRWNG